MADQLATPQDLASLLQLDYASLTAQQQATLTMLVELATAKVQRAAGGQRIVDVTDTAVIDVDPWERSIYLPLPQLPVRSVASVLIDGSPVTDWRLSKQMLRRTGGWVSSSTDATQVSVTYAHGYTAGSQWLQLGRAMTLSLGQLGWANPTGVSAEQIDDYRVSYEDAERRMVITDAMRYAITEAYGAGAYVVSSL